MHLENTLVVLDLETTGTWIEKDKIIEIALIKTSPNGKTETYLKRVNPGMPLPKFISQLTGLTDADLKNAPAFKDIAREVFEFIGQADLAGFNVERFDLPVLEREMFYAGIKFEWQKLKIYDAQKVFHLNEKRDLAAAYQYYCKKELTNAHTALADAQATFEILAAQVDRYGAGEKFIKTLAQYEYTFSEDFYDAERKFRWWNGHLYMMFGKYAKKYSLQEVVQKDPGYLEWIMSADFSPEVKALVQSALQGHLPQPENKSQQIELF